MRKNKTLSWLDSELGNKSLKYKKSKKNMTILIKKWHANFSKECVLAPKEVIFSRVLPKDAQMKIIYVGYTQNLKQP